MKFRYFLVSLVAFGIVACGGGGSEVAGRNTAPAIGQIADQSVTANELSAPIAFTVSDEQITAVTLQVHSDNQPVIADSGLELAGSGANRSLSITPVVDQLGDAFITITATDGDGVSSSRSVLIVVEPQPASMLEFARGEFTGSADADPALVNALGFEQDADHDDFADLLAQ